MNENTPVTTAAARLAYRCAACDLVHVARLFVGASVRFRDAAHALDPDGCAAEDAGVMALVDSACELLALAASSSPGTRLLLVEALERSVGPVATQPES